jgi:hypothetical protein
MSPWQWVSLGLLAFIAVVVFVIATIRADDQ